MDAIALYSYTTFGWLTVQAIPVLAWPSFVSSLLVNEYQPANQVEQYYARALGMTQLALGLTVVVLSGSLPLTSVVDTPGTQVSPYASAVVLITTLYHGFTGFYSYAKYNTTAQPGYVFGAVGSSLFAAFGLWVLLFGGQSHYSKRTGADKRTSGFPFSNSEADKRRPKKDL